MIKSSKVTLKFTNSNKLKTLHSFIDEYKRVSEQLIHILWTEDKLPKFINKEITDKINNTWLTTRTIQCIGKQSSGIVRGTKKKFEDRTYRYNELVNKGYFKQARKLKRIIDNNPINKPIINNINPELDSRFVKIDFNKNNTTFDGWLTLSSLGHKIKINIPIKKHKHLNKILKNGILKPGIRLFKNRIEFNIEVKEPKVKNEGKIIGLDIGQTNVFTTSDNQLSKDDIHGWNLTKINDRLSRKRYGSNGFKQSQDHRKNYVNWTINQLNLNGIKKIRCENIKNLKKGKNCGQLKFWSYPLILDKLENYSLEYGVQIEKINPAYTSQRCNNCGWVRKTNRKGKLFKCTSCNYICDADLNASINISLDLPAISRQKRLSKINIKGFYWLIEDNLGAYSP